MAGEIDDVATAETVEAVHVNRVKDRSVQRYATTAERTSLLPSPVEGDVAYLEDSDDLEIYDGSSWINIAQTAYVDAADALALPKAGGTMSGDLNMGQNDLDGLAGIGTTDFAAADAGSIWSDYTTSDGVIGNATIFTLVDQAARAMQIAVNKQGSRAWVRGIDGVTTDWGDWVELVTSGPSASAGFQFATDTVGANAITTGGTIMLEVNIVAGLDGWIKGHWMLEVERTSAASVSNFYVFPRQDGTNLSSNFAYGTVDAIAANVIPGAGDKTMLTGSFYRSVNAADDSDYEIFVLADDNSRFEVNKGQLAVEFLPYQT